MGTYSEEAKNRRRNSALDARGAFGIWPKRLARYPKNGLSETYTGTYSLMCGYFEAGYARACTMLTAAFQPPSIFGRPLDVIDDPVRHRGLLGFEL